MHAQTAEAGCPDDAGSTEVLEMSCTAAMSRGPSAKMAEALKPDEMQLLICADHRSNQTFTTKRDMKQKDIRSVTVDW